MHLQQGDGRLGRHSCGATLCKSRCVKLLRRFPPTSKQPPKTSKRTAKQPECSRQGRLRYGKSPRVSRNVIALIRVEGRKEPGRTEVRIKIVKKCTRTEENATVAHVWAAPEELIVIEPIGVS